MMWKTLWEIGATAALLMGLYFCVDGDFARAAYSAALASFAKISALDEFLTEKEPK